MTQQVKPDKVDNRILEDGVPVYIQRFKGKQYYRMINPEYVKHIFNKEGCKVLNIEEFENTKSIIKYEFRNKCYTVSYYEWKTDKIRKHLGDYGEKSEFFKSSIYERVKEIRYNYHS